MASDRERRIYETGYRAAVRQIAADMRRDADAMSTAVATTTLARLAAADHLCALAECVESYRYPPLREADERIAAMDAEVRDAE